jgi:predicted RNase H-like nuclease (RuvC/YqgF family)
MNYRNMTVGELERLAYIEPSNLTAQQAYAARCLQEVETLCGEVIQLESKNDELQSELDEAHDEAERLRAELDDMRDEAPA